MLTVSPTTMAAHFSRRPGIEATAPWLLLLLGALVYSNSLHGAFVFDDEVWLNGGDIQQFDQPGRWLFTRTEGPAHGRPLAAFTLAANYALGGRQVIGYHLVNVAVHLLCGLALFGVLRRSLLRPPLRSSFRGQASQLAFAATAVWLVHPLQTECVNYISQRTTSLAALFYLLTFYCAIRGDRSPVGRRWAAGAILSCWLGTGCKEILATAPLLVLLYDYCYRSESLLGVWRRRWTLYAGLATSWLPLGLLLWLAPRSRTVGSHAQFTPLQYALNQCQLLIEYLQLTCWPSKLSIDYGLPAPLTWTEAAPSCLAVSGLLGATVYLLWRRPALGFLGAWFFVILAPTSSFIPIVTEVGAERRMYLPLAAPITLLAAAAALVLSRVKAANEAAAREGSTKMPPALAQRLAAALLLLLLLTLSSYSHRRNALYRNPVAIWLASAEARPDNPRALLNLAAALSQQGHDRQAVRIYQDLVSRHPCYAAAHNNLAVHYQSSGDFAAAAKHFGLSAAHASNWDKPIRNLAELLATCSDDEIRDGERTARTLARYLCNEIDDGNPANFAVLAAAYAECGEFQNAVRIGHIALQRAMEQRRTDLTEQLTEDLRLYRSGKAHREGASAGDTPRRPARPGPPRHSASAAPRANQTRHSA